MINVQDLYLMISLIHLNLFNLTETTRFPEMFVCIHVVCVKYLSRVHTIGNL